MKRLLVFALVATISNASAAFAGESILKSGARHVQQLAVAESSASNSTTTTATATPAATTVHVGQKSTAAFQEPGATGNLSKSGMGKGKKAMIYVGLAVGFVASVWVIDHNVLDVTPSSLGTRKD